MQDMSERRVAERCVDDELDENLAFRWIFGHQTRPSLQSDLFGPRRAEHSAEPLISKGPIPPSPTPLGQKRHLLRNRRPSATDPNSPLQSAAAQMRMSIVHFRHRFFVRQYVYPLLCLLLLIVLIRWTTDRNENEKTEYGRLWHDEGKTDQIQKVNIETVATPLQPLIEEKKVVDSDAVRPAPIAKKPTGNIVSLEVYMEAQCPDTSAFIHRQLVPAWKKLGHLQRINVTIVPFGKALCKPHNEDYICDCQHGPSECDLNGLMNCAMERLVQPREYVPLIGCIQGSDDLDSAIAKCFSPGADKDWISQCSKSKRARYLLAMAGQRTNALGSQFNFVPWVVIDGVRNIDSFYALEENICKLFTTPVPAECLPGSSVQQVQAIEQPFRL